MRPRGRARHLAWKRATNIGVTRDTDLPVQALCLFEKWVREDKIRTHSGALQLITATRTGARRAGCAVEGTPHPAGKNCEASPRGSASLACGDAQLKRERRRGHAAGPARHWPRNFVARPASESALTDSCEAPIVGERQRPGTSTGPSLWLLESHP